jgi:anti-anti-sigma regulatory factor
MLRITFLNEPGVNRMKLEGKLAHEWVNEARKAWAAAMSGTSCEAGTVVDLLSVSFVDDAGHQLLAEMRHAGAELVGSGPLMSALIDEIEEAETATTQDASDGD